MRGFGNEFEQFPLHMNPPLDHRCQRAVQLAGLSARAAGRDDAVTRRAASFFRQLERCRTPRGARGLCQRLPDVAQALALRHSAGLKELELQCRFLARQSADDIAGRMALPAAAIVAYRDLFFAVDGRLNASAYIVREVIGRRIGERPSQRTLMLQAAYHYGPAAVDAWLDYLPHADETHNLETAVGRRRESIALWIDVQCLPDDAETKQVLCRACLFDFSGQFRPLDRAKTVVQVLAERVDRLVETQRWVPPAETADEAAGATVDDLAAILMEKEFRSAWLPAAYQPQMAI